MTTTETMPDAYWCGKLSQGIRELLERPVDDAAVQNLRRLLEDYEVNSGFPPPDAQIRAHVGEDMPLDYLKPGERLINGTIYYSARWLDEGVKEVPGAYRYVIFLNKARTAMMTCWPQKDGSWKIEEATRPWTDGTWGPPEYRTFTGTIENLENLAYRRSLRVKELVL